MGIRRVSRDRPRTITEEQQADLVISYLELRRTIGILGMSLPLILVGCLGIFLHRTTNIAFGLLQHTAA